MKKGPLFLFVLVLAAACLIGQNCSVLSRGPAKKVTVESEKAVASGDYRKALEIYRTACSRDKHDRRLLADYSTLAESMKSQADGHLEHKRYGQALEIYKFLHEEYAGISTCISELSFDMADLESGIKNCLIAVWEIEAGRALKQAAHDKAFNIYKEALKLYPGEKRISMDFVQAANTVKAAADQALSSSRYAAAGNLYRLLLRNFPEFKKAGITPGYSESDLEKPARTCITKLTDTGLAEYRKGRLAEAIAVWGTILEFDPDNAEIKKAVQTARTQLERIKKLNKSVRSRLAGLLSPGTVNRPGRSHI